MGEIFLNHISNMELIYRIDKEVLQLNTKKTNYPPKKYQSKKTFLKKRLQIENKHMNRF